MARHLLISLFFFSGLANAGTQKSFPELYSSWWLIGGELGLMSKGSVESPEVNNSGTQIGGKGVYSKYWSNWVGDLGFGYRYDTMEKSDVSIETKAFVAEIGARYRLNNKWSFGPELQLLMGQDVSFSDIGTNSDDRAKSLFLGLRVFYDVFKKNPDRLLRIGAQAHTDIDIKERQVTYIQLVAEYGWPWGKKEVVKTKPTPQPTPQPIVKRPPTPTPSLKLNLKEGGVRFASGSSELAGRSLDVIERLAIVLKDHQTQWSFIKVAGHTDIIGDYRKNIQLSLSRAESVRNVLVDFGIPDTRISAQGFGPDRPLDNRRNRKAYALNRRVELNIVSENATPEFAQKLKGVLQK